jgi:hypothetical protein
MACCGLLRALLEQRSWVRCYRLLPHQSDALQAARVRQCGLDQASLAAGSRRQRGPIAIAAALDDHRGVRRGFLPRGLCNTCPDAAMALDRQRVQVSHKP